MLQPVATRDVTDAVFAGERRVEAEPVVALGVFVHELGPDAVAADELDDGAALVQAAVARRAARVVQEETPVGVRQRAVRQAGVPVAAAVFVLLT